MSLQFLMPSYEQMVMVVRKCPPPKACHDPWRILEIQLSSAKQLFHTFSYLSAVARSTGVLDFFIPKAT